MALCPIHSISRFEEVNAIFKQKGRWEQVRKGRVEGLHLLASPEDPTNNRHVDETYDSVFLDLLENYATAF